MASDRGGRCVDNARNWSPSEGIIEVTLHGGVLRVRDHGPGFDEQDLPHVFDRFYRADAARGKSGSGLGLAIVRQAVADHGGSARATNAPGGGALIELSFGPPLSTGEEPVSAEDRSSAARRHIERSGSPFALQIGGLIAAGAGKL